MPSGSTRSNEAPLPRYVTDTFERYLACGDFAEGFVRCRCDTCGHDVLVPFSCKARGLCPSCGARRMCDEAAHLTDRVFPSAPLRQWVLSLPFELRGLAATAEPPAAGPLSTAHLAPVVDAGPTTITVKHWGRLLDGELLAPGPRVDWATLLKRTFGFDALECPRCTKRMRVLAAITDRATARAILVHLGLSTEPAARAPPREPAWVQLGFGVA